MSYILDALQRAEAERTRTSVPGLHARPATLPLARDAARLRWQWALAGALLSGLGALTGWYWQTLNNSKPSPVVAPTVAAQAAVTVVPGVQTTSIMPATAASMPVFPTGASSAPPSVALNHTAEKSALPAASALPPLLGELPAVLRQQIPVLTINGVVYSDQPTQRLLLVNNLVLNQGSQVASELKLEEIHAKESVFNFRGTRFRLVH